MVTAKLIHIIIVHVTVITEYVSSNDWNIFCYFNAKARHREPSIRFDTFNIDFSLCTHYVYAYARVDPQAVAITANDPITEASNPGSYLNFTGKNLDTRRKAKTLLSIGGPDASAQEALVEVTKTEENIGRFSQSVLRFLMFFGFDGLDIDWQNPATIAMRSTLIRLLEVLRHTFDVYKVNGMKLLLTLKCPGVYSSNGFDVPAISRLVDYVVISAYNLPTPDSTHAWFGSPLYTMPVSVNSSVRQWLQKGLSASKTVVGITGVGRYFKLKDETRYEPGSSIHRVVLTGPHYKVPNALAYPEICEVIRPDIYFDDPTKMHYLRVRDTWIGHEDSESIKAKITWMKNLYLAGIMFAELDMDDFTGTKCHRGPFPLAQAIKQLSDSIPTLGLPTNITTTEAAITRTKETLTRTKETLTTTEETLTAPNAIINATTSDHTTHSKEVMPWNQNNLCANEDSRVYKYLAVIIASLFALYVMVSLMVFTRRLQRRPVNNGSLQHD